MLTILIPEFDPAWNVWPLFLQIGASLLESGVWGLEFGG